MVRYVFGLLGANCRRDSRKKWNTLLTGHKVNGFVDFYRTVTENDLELRLSEMFLHGRIGYVLEAPLQKPVQKMLDRLSPSAKRRKRVDTIVNERGVLVGYYLDGLSSEEKMRKQLSLWLEAGST